MILWINRVGINCVHPVTAKPRWVTTGMEDCSFHRYICNCCTEKFIRDEGCLFQSRYLVWLEVCSEVSKDLPLRPELGGGGGEGGRGRAGRGTGDGAWGTAALHGLTCVPWESPTAPALFTNLHKLHSANRVSVANVSALGLMGRGPWWVRGGGGGLVPVLLPSVLCPGLDADG